MCFEELRKCKPYDHCVGMESNYCEQGICDSLGSTKITKVEEDECIKCKREKEKENKQKA
jgi:hypothetical protein